MRMSDCERYSVGTWLMDQRVLAGPPESEVIDFRLVHVSATPPSSVRGMTEQSRAEVVLSLASEAEKVAARVRYRVEETNPLCTSR